MYNFKELRENHNHRSRYRLACVSGWQQRRGLYHKTSRLTVYSHINKTEHVRQCVLYYIILLLCRNKQ